MKISQMKKSSQVLHKSQARSEREKASEASFNEVAQRPSERRSREVDLFRLRGFESY